MPKTTSNRRNGHNSVLLPPTGRRVHTPPTNRTAPHSAIHSTRYSPMGRNKTPRAHTPSINTTQSLHLRNPQHTEPKKRPHKPKRTPRSDRHGHMPRHSTNTTPNLNPRPHKRHPNVHKRVLHTRLKNAATPTLQGHEQRDQTGRQRVETRTSRTIAKSSRLTQPASRRSNGNVPK